MQELANIFVAMGMWGWFAVIACTYLIVEGAVRIKKMQLEAQMGIPPGDPDEDIELSECESDEPATAK